MALTWLESLVVWGSPLAALVALALWLKGERRLAWLLGGALTFAALVTLSGVVPFARGDHTLLIAKSAATLALVVMSIMDWRTRRVPRELSWAWLGAGFVATAARFVQVQDMSAVPYWVGFYALWQAGILGGGDAKLLMGAFGLWPDPALLWLVVGGMVAWGLAWEAWRYRARAVSRLAQVTTDLLANGLTTTRLDPVRLAATWAFALAVGFYVWRWA